jgi:DNA (cytosine-5)-methyltransferase 3A
LRVLSLFDGIGCGRLALQIAGFHVKQYLASEICDRAISVSQLHFPDIEQIGCVRKVEFSAIGEVDLLFAGFPCTDLSSAGNKTGLEGVNSSLYRRVVDAITTCKPTWFLVENVVPKKEDKIILDKAFGVEGVVINSSLVSAQNRKRCYWTNIPIGSIKDRGKEFNQTLYRIPHGHTKSKIYTPAKYPTLCTINPGSKDVLWPSKKQIEPELC